MDFLMNYFETVLTCVVLFTGIIYGLDVLFWARKRVAREGRMSKIVEYSRSFFPVLLIVLVIRSFLFEPYRIPSGSLKPTLLVGDLISVKKFSYGIRLPVTHTKIIKIGEPKVGDIVVFRMPGDPHMDLIKRIVGVPGDRLSYINKVLSINGVMMTQTAAGETRDNNGGPESWPVLIKNEALTDRPHQIYVRPDLNLSGDFQNVLVPEGQYFAMGDNRDDSNDSRFWGFVPEANIVGKADRVVISWNSDTHRPRWNRSLKRID